MSGNAPAETPVVAAGPRSPGTTLVVSGTGTGVGKTVVTAAIAVLAARRGVDVAVVKPAQTGLRAGEPGDVDEIRRLARVTGLHEHARFPAALSPEAAARVSGLAPADLSETARQVASLSATGRLVLVEGAGGLAVRYDGGGATVADLARALGAPVLVVTAAGLGTLNHTALTLEALAARGLTCAGLVIGAWPAEPDLAMRCNVTDLAALAGGRLRGALPEGAGTLPPPGFHAVARAGLAPALGGTFDPAKFGQRYGPPAAHEGDRWTTFSR